MHVSSYGTHKATFDLFYTRFFEVEWLGFQTQQEVNTQLKLFWNLLPLLVKLTRAKSIEECILCIKMIQTQFSFIWFFLYHLHISSETIKKYKFIQELNFLGWVRKIYFPQACYMVQSYLCAWMNQSKAIFLKFILSMSWLKTI